MRGIAFALLAAGLPQCGPVRVVFGDHDRDGFHRPRDCDDRDAAIHPGATDVPGDGVDQDCDGADATSGDTGAVDTDVVPDDTDTDAVPDDTDSDAADSDSDTVGDTGPGGNHAPVVTACTISPTAASTTTRFSVQVVASDPDGDPITTTTAWWHHNLGSPELVGPTGDTGPTLASCEERWSGGYTNPANCYPLSEIWVVCEATDDGGRVGTRASEHVTIQARTPVLEVALSPDLLVAGEDVVAQVAISDFDHIPVTYPQPDMRYTYAWSVNGTAVATTVPERLDSDLFEKGDSVRVDVTLVDTVYQYATTAFATRTVADSAPTLDTCSVSPATGVRVSTALTGSAGGLADPDPADSPTVAYQWQLQQFPAWVNLPGRTSAMLPSCLDRDVPPNDPDAIYDCTRGSKLRLTCTPVSGSVRGAPVVSSTVLIENSPPVVDSVAIDPPSPTAADTLAAVATAHDDDDEAVTLSYVWLVDGVEVGTTSTLSPASFASGDEVTLEVRARDAFGDASPTASTSVAIP